jgi:hypothetical protein
MTKPATESWAQVRQEHKIKTRGAVKLMATVTVFAAVALLLACGGARLRA